MIKSPKQKSEHKLFNILKIAPFHNDELKKKNLEGR